MKELNPSPNPTFVGSSGAPLFGRFLPEGWVCLENVTKPHPCKNRKDGASGKARRSFVFAISLDNGVVEVAGSESGFVRGKRIDWFYGIG